MFLQLRKFKKNTNFKIPTLTHGLWSPWLVLLNFFTCKCLYFFWFNYFLDAKAEIRDVFSLKTPQFPSEISWPLTKECIGKHGESFRRQIFHPFRSAEWRPWKVKILYPKSCGRPKKKSKIIIGKIEKFEHRGWKLPFFEFKFKFTPFGLL